MRLSKLFATIGLTATFAISSIIGLPYSKKVKAQQPASRPFGYILKSAIWNTNSIPVCWENPSNNFSAEMIWVRDAVANSWGAIPNSRVQFINWNQCSSNSSGIRIQINDEGPHTKGLGFKLNGVSNGMVLNFTFQNWSPACQTTRERCIKLIAIHEFGHALSFAHEQNRIDTPVTQPNSTKKFCTEERQGSDGDVTIGAWDLNSVMNYCNPQWNGNGRLSDVDIQTFNSVYGPAPNPFVQNSIQESSFSGPLVEGMIVQLQTLGDINGLRWLDGRTGDGTVGLVSSENRGFSGTKWRVHKLNNSDIALECLGEINGARWLDGRTGDGTVGLAPKGDGSFSGAVWRVHRINKSDIRLESLGTIEGPRWLDGRTADGTVGLVSSENRGFSGTKWRISIN